METSDITVRAAPTTYIVTGCVFGPLLLLYVFLAITKGIGSAWWIVLLLAAVLSFAWLWTAFFRVSFRENVVTFRSLFRGTRSMPISMIKDIRTETHLGGHRPVFSLVVIPKAPGAEALVINMKVFRLAELRELIRILEIAIGKDIPWHESLVRGVRTAK